MVLDNLNRTTTWIKAAFPNIPVFPVIGNHDNFLSDQLAPPPLGSQWLSKIGEMWSMWLSDDALQTFNYGGYYTTLIHPGLRIIGINTVFCDIVNSWSILYPGKDIGGQFAWLNKTLLEAKKNEEKVFLIGHRAPGFSDSSNDINMFPYCNDQFIYIFTEFQNVISNMFFAHEHLDTFRILNNMNGQPVTSLFLCPSLTTFVGVNPGLRLYSYDKQQRMVTNWHQFVANLTKANEIGSVDFSFSYDPLSEYSLPSLDTSSLNALGKSFYTSSSLWNKFYFHYGNEAPRGGCDDGCMTNILCAMLNMDIGSYTDCDFHQRKKLNTL